MEFTGERYVPALKGQISYEHLHRYAIAARYAAGKRVLDIASGEGYGSALLARTAAEVVGVDVDPDAVEHARRSYYVPNLRFLCGSATEIPLPDAAVDLVACFETIEHVAEHDRLLDELRRVLTPGGVLVLSSPNKLIYSDAARYENPYHVKELYFSELRDLLARRFRYVGLYGQRVAAHSVVHPLAGSVSTGASWYSADAGRVVAGLPSLPDPVYFVAVCSDEPLPDDVSSAYVDPADDLLRDIVGELHTLRHDARLALENAARVALPASHAEPAHDAAPDTIDEAAVDERAEAEAAEAAARQAEREEAHARELEALRAAHELERTELRAAHERERTELRQLLETRAAAALAETEATVAALRERVQLEAEASRTLHGRVVELETETRRLRDAAAAANAALEDERRRCERLMLQVTEAQDHAEDAERRAEAAERSAAEQHAAHAHAAADAAALREQVAGLAAALDDARRAHAALAEVLSSRSWKVTEPLRRAAALIRR